MTQSIKNIVAALLIAISSYYLLSQDLPLFDLTSDMKNVIAERQVLLESYKKIADSIRDIAKDKDSRYSEIQRLALLAPKKYEIPEVITTVEAMFKKSGLNLSEIQITSQASKKNEPFNYVKIKLSTTTTDYFTILNLLDLVERNLRVIDIDKLGISKDNKVSGGLGVSVEATMYSINPDYVVASSIISKTHPPTSKPADVDK